MTANELGRRTLAKLTDAFMIGFAALSDEERAWRMSAKVRLRAKLADVDLLDLTVNQRTAEAEEYKPDGDGR